MIKKQRKGRAGPQRLPDRGPDLFRIVRGALPGAVLRLPGLLLCPMVVRRVLGLFRVHAGHAVVVRSDAMCAAIAQFGTIKIYETARAVTLRV